MTSKANIRKSGFLALNAKGQVVRRALQAGTNVDSIENADGRDGNPIINASTQGGGGGSAIQWIEGTSIGGVHTTTASKKLYAGQTVTGAAQAGDKVGVTFSCEYERQFAGVGTTTQLQCWISTGTTKNIGNMQLELSSTDVRRGTGFVAYEDSLISGLISGGNITVEIYTNSGANMKLNAGRLIVTLSRGV